MNIKRVKDTVLELLELYEKARDNDQFLMLCVWNRQNSKLNTRSGTSYVDFVKDFQSGKLSTPESITRARRSLQNEFEHLRGKKYNSRMNEQERVKKDLGYT